MNNEQDNKNTESLEHSVLDKIKAGETRMVPRWHFVLQTALYLLGVVVLSLLSLYIASFVLFVIRQHGVLFAPAFGVHGLSIFLLSLPWILVIVCIIFIILLELLLRHYALTYRRPLLYSVVAILLFTMFGGAAVVKSGFHDALRMHAARGNLPIAGPLYNSGSRPLKHIHPGVITNTNPQGFTMLRFDDDDAVYVVITTTTRVLPAGSFHVEDRVVILGNKKGNTIHAFGVRRIVNTMHDRFFGGMHMFAR